MLDFMYYLTFSQLPEAVEAVCEVQAPAGQQTQGDCGGQTETATQGGSAAGNENQKVFFLFYIITSA